MSRMVEARELRPRDMFEMPNGSVYMTASQGAPGGAPQARLWCAHPPDVVPAASDPPLIELAAGQSVRLLSGKEADTHAQHAGFIEAAFRHEMDRRHQAMMQVVGKNTQRAATAQRLLDLARRPWWKKRFR